MTRCVDALARCRGISATSIAPRSRADASSSAGLFRLRRQGRLEPRRGYRIALMPDAQLCVFCRRQPVDPAWRPFCSERCKGQDLARWADGRYRVPGERVERVTDPDAGESEKSDV